MCDLRNIFGFEEKRSFSKLSKDASNVTDATKAKPKVMTMTPKLIVYCPSIV